MVQLATFGMFKQMQFLSRDTCLCAHLDMDPEDVKPFFVVNMSRLVLRDFVTKTLALGHSFGLCQHVSGYKSNDVHMEFGVYWRRVRYFLHASFCCLGGFAWKSKWTFPIKWNVWRLKPFLSCHTEGAIESPRLWRTCLTCFEAGPFAHPGAVERFLADVRTSGCKWMAGVGCKKCIKGGSWGEVGCMSACCGFMFVVNLCSLPLSYFVRFFFGFFLCLRPKFFILPCFVFFSFFLTLLHFSSLLFLFFVLFCLPLLFHFYVIMW